MTSQTETPNSDANKPLLENSERRTVVQNSNLANLDEEKNTTKQKERGVTNNKIVVILEKKLKKTDDEKWKLVPPDGGWGWLVLIGSTLVNVLVPGMVKSFGILFTEFLEVFNATEAEGMWIPALCYFLYSSLGPVSSILSLRYSYRTVTVVGGTFAAMGMILSFWANSIPYLYVTYGVLVGIGAGLAFPPTVYIVTSYFVRLRGVANGICISGSALGSIIIPPVLRVILEYYGYRGAVLLMGGLTLNVWVAALFYDPVDKHMKKVPIDQDNNGDKKEDTETSEYLQAKFIISQEDSMASLQQIPHNDSFLENLDASSGNFNRSASSAAFQNIKSQMQQQQRERKISMPTGRQEVLRAKSGTTGAHAIMNSSSALHAVPEKQNGAMDMFSQGRLPSSKRPRSGVPKRSPSTSSFQYVSTPYHGSTLTLQPETFASSFSLRSIRTNKTGDKNETVEEPQKKVKFFDISLLKDPIYLVILLSNATNAISYTNFIILLATYATKSLKFSKDASAILLSVVSAFDLIGRIGGSALSDLTSFPKCWYFIGGLFISGTSLSLMSFFKEYYVICLFCSVFGLASGVYVGITAVIMAEMLGEERLQSSYGISLFVNGILQLIGPPICGVWLQHNSYTSLFCSLGLITVLGTGLWGIVPFVKEKSPEKDEDIDYDSS